MSEQVLFPTVGLRTQGEEVRANFGAAASGPFKTDMTAAMAELKQRALARVRGVPLPACTPSSGGAGLLQHLVFEYLRHSRCWHTAEIVARDMLAAPSSSANGARAAGSSGVEGASGMEVAMTESEGAAAASASAGAGAGVGVLYGKVVGEAC